MTCRYLLPPSFTDKHPETTCQDVVSLARLNQNSEPESITTDAWYDRNIASILDHLPPESPSQQHHNQAVYWLARTALRSLIGAFYGGEISLIAFILCRDGIREWEISHRTETSNADDIEMAGYQTPRKWAAQLVRKAVQSSNRE